MHTKLNKPKLAKQKKTVSRRLHHSALTKKTKRNGLITSIGAGLDQSSPSQISLTTPHSISTSFIHTAIQSEQTDDLNQPSLHGIDERGGIKLTKKLTSANQLLTTQRRKFALQTPQRPSTRDSTAETIKTEPSFDVNTNQDLFLPPKSMDDIKKRKTEFATLAPPAEFIASISNREHSPYIPHPTKSGQLLGPKLYELNPDEISPSLMAPFISGKFQPNQFGQSPIAQAVLSDNFDILKQLLSIDIHDHCNAMAKRIHSDPRVVHPLKDILYASDSTPENPSFAARYLMSFRDLDGICPLFYSLAKGKIQLPQLLVAHGAFLGYEYVVPEAELGENQKSAFEHAQGGSDDKIAPLFHRQTILSIAASIGDLNLVEMLLLAGSNPNQVLSSYQEQRLAGYVDYVIEQTNIYGGQKRLFDIANQVEMEKSPGDRDLDLLDSIANYYKTYSFYKNNLKIAESYLLKSARFQALPKVPFNSDSLVHRQNEMIKRADVNQQKSFLYHQTPLTTAVLNGNAELVQLFIRHGADIQLANYLHGQSLLEIAVYTNNVDMLVSLLDGIVALRDPQHTTRLYTISSHGQEILTKVQPKLHQHNVDMLEPRMLCATKTDLARFEVDQRQTALNTNDLVALENTKKCIIGDLAFQEDQNGNKIYIDHTYNKLISESFPKPLLIKKRKDFANVGVFATDFSAPIPRDFIDEKNQIIYLDPWKDLSPKYNNVARIESYRWQVMESLQSKIENELWNEHLKVLRSEGLDPLKVKSKDIFEMTNEMTPKFFRRTQLSKLEYLTLRGISIFEQFIDFTETQNYEKAIQKISQKVVLNKTTRNYGHDGKKIPTTMLPDRSLPTEPDPLTQSTTNGITLPPPPLIVTGRRKTPLDKAIGDLLKELNKSVIPPVKPSPDAPTPQQHPVIKPEFNDDKVLVNNKIYTTVVGYPPLFEYQIAESQVRGMKEDIKANAPNPETARLATKQLESTEPFQIVKEYKRVINSKMDDWHKQYYDYLIKIFPIFKKHAENVSQIRKQAQYYALHRKRMWVEGTDMNGNVIPGLKELTQKNGFLMGQAEFQYQQHASKFNRNDPNFATTMEAFAQNTTNLHLNAVQSFIGSYLKQKRKNGGNDFDFRYQSDGSLTHESTNWDESFDPMFDFDPANPDAVLNISNIDPVNDPYWLLTPFDSGDSNVDFETVSTMITMTDDEYLKHLQAKKSKGDPALKTHEGMNNALKQRVQYRIYSDQVRAMASDQELSNLLKKFDPSRGEEQMENLLSLDPFWSTTKITQANNYYYYIKQRGHLPSDLSSLVNFNRLKDIASHFGKIEALLTLAHFRGGIAIPPNSEDIMVDVDETVRFGDFNRNKMMETIEEKYLQKMESSGKFGFNSDSLLKTRRDTIADVFKDIDGTEGLKLNAMVQQHTLDTKNKLEAENPSAAPKEIFLPETTSSTRLIEIKNTFEWVVEAYNSGELKKIFLNNDLLEGGQTFESLGFDSALMDYFRNDIINQLSTKIDQVKDYEVKFQKADPNSRPSIPLVARFELSAELMELLPVFEELYKDFGSKDDDFTTAVAQNMDFAAFKNKVGSTLDPADLKARVLDEVKLKKQYDDDQRIIMSNLSGLDTARLQRENYSDVIGGIAADEDSQSLVMEQDAEYYKTRGGYTRPYPMSYRKVEYK